jgi:hypothetical protein
MSEGDDREAPLTFGNRLRKGLLEFAIDTPIILFVAYLFEVITGPSGVEFAKHANQVFSNAIGAFDPYQIFQYILGGASYILIKIAQGLLLVFSDKTTANILSLTQWFLYPIVGLMVIAWLPLVIAIDTWNNGHVAEGLIAILCWCIVVFVTRRNRKSGRRTDPNFTFFEIVVVTIAMLWAIKLIMIGIDQIFREYIQLKDACAGGSALATWAYWCTTKRGEHSVAQIATSFFRRLV